MFFSRRKDARTILDFRQPDSLRARKRAAGQARAAGYQSTPINAPVDNEVMDDMSDGGNEPQFSPPPSPEPIGDPDVDRSYQDDDLPTSDSGSDTDSNSAHHTGPVGAKFLFNYRRGQRKQCVPPPGEEEKGGGNKRGGTPKDYPWSRPGVREALRDNLASRNAVDLGTDFCQTCGVTAIARCEECGLLCAECAQTHHVDYLFHYPKFWDVATGQLTDVERKQRPTFVNRRSNNNVVVKLIDLLGVASVTVEHEPDNLFGELVSRGYVPLTPTEQCRTAISTRLFRFIEGLGASVASVLDALALTHGIDLPPGLSNEIHDCLRHWKEARNNVKTLSTVMTLPQGCPACFQWSFPSHSQLHTHTHTHTYLIFPQITLVNYGWTRLRL
jgi:hypothetical protein